MKGSNLALIFIGIMVVATLMVSIGEASRDTRYWRIELGVDRFAVAKAEPAVGWLYPSLSYTDARSGLPVHASHYMLYHPMTDAEKVSYMVTLSTPSTNAAPTNPSN